MLKRDGLRDLGHWERVKQGVRWAAWALGGTRHMRRVVGRVRRDARLWNGRLVGRFAFAYGRSGGMGAVRESEKRDGGEAEWLTYHVCTRQRWEWVECMSHDSGMGCISKSTSAFAFQLFAFRDSFSHFPAIPPFRPLYLMAFIQLHNSFLTFSHFRDFLYIQMPIHCYYHQLLYKQIYSGYNNSLSCCWSNVWVVLEFLT